MPYTAGPFDTSHLYLQWGGKLPGNEQWSCGLRLRNKTGAGFNNDATPAMLAGAVTAITAYHTDGQTQIGSIAKLSVVKLNLVGTDGKYVDAASYSTVIADVAGGGGATPTFPNQVALAVTLTTGFSRGPAHKGRFYIPTPAIYVGATGVIAAESAVLVSNTTDTLIAALNALNANWEVAVFSRKAGAAGNRRVTGNLVGRVLDTQRRRRRSLIEDYR